MIAAVLPSGEGGVEPSLHALRQAAEARGHTVIGAELAAARVGAA